MIAPLVALHGNPGHHLKNPDHARIGFPDLGVAEVHAEHSQARVSAAFVVPSGGVVLFPTTPGTDPPDPGFS